MLCPMQAFVYARASLCPVPLRKGSLQFGIISKKGEDGPTHRHVPWVASSPQGAFLGGCKPVTGPATGLGGGGLLMALPSN